MDDKDATYLGDGVYALHTGFHIEIFTHNGFTRQATIYIEGSVLEALINYAKRKEFIKE